MKLPLTLMFLGGAALLALSWEVYSRDDNEYGLLKHSSVLSAPKSERYQAECGSCHMAYPPGLLPARSWQALMAGLDKHFGDDASLDPATAAEISRYLAENSADHNDSRFSRKVQNSVTTGDTPLRITETPFFRREHRELPQRVVRDNPKVGSLGNCLACHTRADQGSFREREIRIPGYGRWDD